ncbi:MAG TPA: hypothetical protein VEV17_23870 [Bryobacteraceae bacterium]|nr:hypothetical protein [Bryobacteraceae bacterium]
MDQDVRHLSTAVAIREKHPNVLGLTWLRVYFYSFGLDAGDVARVRNGSVEALERKREQTAATAQECNRSFAVVQLAIDRDSNVANVNLEVPGVTCTIASTPEAAKRAFPEYQFDGTHLRLKGKGAFVCDLTSVGMAKRELGWDVDVNLPVFSKR